jgi:glycosyltransferase involved in cell wall biosynthesis
MKKISPIKISVIVTTYNWPQALRAVLNALVEQKTIYPFEIIIADDGSCEETAKLVRVFKNKSPIPLLHIWQPDEGFKAAAIRNKAILVADGDYIIFLDGDCIPREDFINKQMLLAEANTFVAGNRVLLNRDFTVAALSQQLSLHQWSLFRWWMTWFKGHCNRVSPFLRLPFSGSFKSRHRWRGAKGCNLSIWKADLLQVNGWEEKFVGWGYEDSDLVIRLLQSAVKRKSGRFRIPVVHLWHPENDRSFEQKNAVLLQERRKKKQLCSDQGINQYAQI